MSAAREPLGKHVAPRLTGERLTKQWEAIESKVDTRPPRRLAFPLGVAFATAVAALALFVYVKRPPPAVMAATLVDGTWVESPAAGPPSAVTLADGSKVALGASSRMRLTSTRADAVRLDLERGRVDVQATHRSGRTFTVVARDVEVNVVGTRFSVEADGSVRVRVEEGRVQVHDASGDRFVSGGEEWVALEVKAAPSAAPSSGPDDTTDDSNDDDRADEPAGAPSSHAAPRPGARGLLRDAQQAVAQGKTSDAARLFDAIRREHRNDPRAGLAAFELGRLRLDSLGDPAGAEEAFRDAMRLSRDSGLRDDAEARRVQALDKMGARARCERAKGAYLTNHPSGVHRAEVTGWCGGT